MYEGKSRGTSGGCRIRRPRRLRRHLLRHCRVARIYLFDCG